MQIKFLAGEGVPKKRIAERLGVSRQTVYNHLNRKKGEPFPKPRPARPSLLDPFRDYIEARLERFGLPATVVFQEIKEQGYRGGLTILRGFVRPLKQEFVRRVTERFETLPGQQAQIDWGECGTIEVDAERKRLYVFVMVLGYSRMMYVRFTTLEDVEFATLEWVWWFNHYRLLRPIGHLPPAEYEEAHYPSDRSGRAGRTQLKRSPIDPGRFKVSSDQSQFLHQHRQDYYESKG